MVKSKNDYILYFTIILIFGFSYNNISGQKVVKKLFGKTLHIENGKEFRDSLIFYTNKTVKFQLIDSTCEGLIKYIGYGKYKFIKIRKSTSKYMLINTIKYPDVLNITSSRYTIHKSNNDSLIFKIHTSNGKLLKGCEVHIFTYIPRKGICDHDNYITHSKKSGILKAHIKTFPADSIIAFSSFGFQYLPIKLDSIKNQIFDITLQKGFIRTYEYEPVLLILFSNNFNIVNDNINILVWMGKVTYRKRNEKLKKLNYDLPIGTDLRTFSTFNFYDEKGYKTYLKKKK